MKYISLISFLLLNFLYSGEDYKKLGQTNFLFLSVPIDARGTAMASAQTADSESGVTSMFYNPAVLSMQDEKIGFESHYFNFLYDITHYALGASFKLNNNMGVVGLNMHFVDLGEYDRTIIADNVQGYFDFGKEQLSEYALGVTYSQRISSQFSVGFNLKYAAQNLGQALVLNNDGEFDGKKYVTNTFAVDFGTLFDTQIRGLKFGVSIRNFSAEPVYEKNSFQLPLTFSIGLSSDLFELMNIQTDKKMKILLDLVHPRSYPEYYNLGMEYCLGKLIYLRAGYMGNRDIFDYNAGFGVTFSKITFDYSYSKVEWFESTQKFTLKFKI